MLLKPKVVDRGRLYKLSECGTSNLQPSRKKNRRKWRDKSNREKKHADSAQASTLVAPILDIS